MGKKLFLFAAAAVALASCTETDLSGDTSFAKESTSDAIQFSAKARGAGATRSGVLGGITTTNILKGIDNTVGANVSTANVGFGVIAYNTGATEWANDQDSYTPNFMYNQQVKWNSTTNAWEYTPIKYWPNGIDAANAANSPSNTATENGVQKLSFFAYAPYVDKSAALSGVGITKINSSEKAIGSEDGGTGNKLAAAPTVNYTLSSSDVHAAANVDLLWGVRGDAIYSETDNDDNTATAGDTYNTSLTKENVPEKVNFLFKHALAKIGGYDGLKIVADIDGNGGGSIGYGTLDEKSCITVRQITIQNTATATNYAGVFHLATGAWSDLTGGTPTKGGLFNEDIKDGTSSTIAMSDGATGIYAPESSLPTYSSSWSVEGVTTTAKEVYKTNTQDGFYMIPGASMQLEVVINYDVSTVDGNIDGGYVRTNQVITNTVTLPATLESNKFYTLVIHLGLTSVKFSAEVANWDAEDVGTEKEIWLPSNVVKYTTAATVAAGANATVNTTAAQTSYTINLTGLQASTDLSVVTPAGAATDASQTTATDGSGNGAVTVTLTANSSETATQTGTVTIKGVDTAGKDFTMVVTIIQEKKYTSSTDIALNSSKVVYANAAAGSYTINVTGLTASGAYTVTSTGGTDATVAPSGNANASGEATVGVTLTENAGDTRAFTITIKDTTTGKESSVVINQIHK